MSSKSANAITPNFDQFNADVIAPFNFTGESHDTAMEELNETVMLQGSGGQSVSGLHMNRSASSNVQIVRVNSLGSSSATRQQKYVAYQLAAANPEHSVLMIDLFSHGYSDRFSSMQRAEMTRYKRLSRVGFSLASAVVAHSGASTDYVIEGDSFGAQAAVELCRGMRQLGAKPKLLIGFDMTGTNKIPARTEIMKRFKSSSGHGNMAYHMGVGNRTLDQGYQEFSNELDKYGYQGPEYSWTTVPKRDPFFVAGILTRSPISSDMALQTLHEVLSEDEQLAVAMVSGGLSRVCNWNIISPKVLSLLSSFEDRITWEVSRNDSHSMGIAEQQPRSAAYLKAQIAHLAIAG